DRPLFGVSRALGERVVQPALAVDVQERDRRADREEELPRLAESLPPDRAAEEPRGDRSDRTEQNRRRNARIAAGHHALRDDPDEQAQNDEREKAEHGATVDHASPLPDSVLRSD